MSSFVKFQTFVQDLGRKVHNLETDVIKLYLTNTAPDVAADFAQADLPEISAGNGYTAGGVDCACSYSQSGGVATLTGSDVTITASGGNIGPFRYGVLWNSTADRVIGYWDKGSNITLIGADGDSVTFDFGASLLTVT